MKNPIFLSLCLLLCYLSGNADAWGLDQARHLQPAHEAWPRRLMHPTKPALLTKKSHMLKKTHRRKKSHSVKPLHPSIASHITRTRIFYNVKKYGAHANGRHDDAKAFMAAWNAACSSSGNVTVRIPRGTYLVGPVKFTGPCTNVDGITLDTRGYVKASTDLNLYVQGDDWIEFRSVDKLTLIGGGTYDGQGALAWPYDKCPMKKDCKVLPTSLKFVSTTNTVVRQLKSVNSKFFHIALVGCNNFWGSQFTISAPENSPNTDGIHLDRSTNVALYSSTIATGDDCVSIGQGNFNVLVSGVNCGPGHGISIGSLGRYNDEGDVRGVVVRDSTLSGTMFGLRIKTWENSPKQTTVRNLTFDGIMMNSVGNPIYIDQMYCPYSKCNDKSPSKVKIADVTFNNVRGTSSTPVAVTLKCSKAFPCHNVNLKDVNLRYIGQRDTTSTCLNVKARYSGMQVPAPCR